MSEPLRVDANFEAIRAAGPWLRSVLEPLGPERSDALAGSIELAVHEMATNSIDHGQSSVIDLHATLTDKSLAIVLTDDGDPFEGNDSPAQHPEEPQVRGYGLVIVEALTESVTYERQTAGNKWTMRFGIDSHT